MLFSSQARGPRASTLAGLPGSLALRRGAFCRRRAFTSTYSPQTTLVASDLSEPSYSGPSSLACLQDLLLRSPSSYYAPLEVTHISGKGRGVVATNDFAAGELLIASSPFALVEAVPELPPAAVTARDASLAGDPIGSSNGSSSSSSRSISNTHPEQRVTDGASTPTAEMFPDDRRAPPHSSNATDRSGSSSDDDSVSCGGAGRRRRRSSLPSPSSPASLRQPGAADLVRLLTDMRDQLTPRQLRLLTTLFNGRPAEEDDVGPIGNGLCSSRDPGPGDDEGGIRVVRDSSSSTPRLRQLASLAPPVEGERLKALLLPTGELVLQQHAGPVVAGDGDGDIPQDGDGVLAQNCTPPSSAAQRAEQQHSSGSGSSSNNGDWPPEGSSSSSLHSVMPATQNRGRLCLQQQQALQVQQTQQQQPLDGGVGWSSLGGAVVFNCYGEPSPDALFDKLLLLSSSSDKESGIDDPLPGTGRSSGYAYGGNNAPRTSLIMSTAGGYRGGFVGLWADFAMLNHSCCPNTINLVGGPNHHMLVRATEPIGAGEEVTVCYFGRELLAPRSVRSAATMRSHGFECGCARCKYKMSLGPEVEAALLRVYTKVNEEWGPCVSDLAARLDGARTALQEACTAAATADGSALEQEPSEGLDGQRHMLGHRLLLAGAPLLGALLMPFGRPKGASKQQQKRVAASAQAEVSAVVQQLLELEARVVAELDLLEGSILTAARGAADNGGVPEREHYGHPRTQHLHGRANPSTHFQATASLTPTAKGRWWLLASLYDALELRLNIWELLRDVADAPAAAPAMGAPGTTASSTCCAAVAVNGGSLVPSGVHGNVLALAIACLEVVQAVCPGSTLHIELAIKVATESAKSTPSAQQLDRLQLAQPGNKWNRRQQHTVAQPPPSLHSGQQPTELTKPTENIVADAVTARLGACEHTVLTACVMSLM